MFTEIHCVISGKVQGVGYRDYIDRYVREHNLSGWIKNMEDTSVEVVIQGTPEELKTCIEVLNQGSPLSKVEGLSVDWRTPEKQYSDFEITSS